MSTRKRLTRKTKYSKKAAKKSALSSPSVATTTTGMTLKLLVDKKANRVIFAEAGKDIVDFLFSLLTLPLATVIGLLTKNKMVGCIGKLYQSVESLDDTYVLNPSTCKDVLLTPKLASATPINLPLLTSEDDSVEESVPHSYYYTCGACRYYLTTDKDVKCPRCHTKMLADITYVASNTHVAASSDGVKGYVREVVTYMVMDDLRVMPMSTISSITLLNKFNVENVKLLEEKVVVFGMKEALKLLKISLQSKTALSEVFLGS